MRDREIHTVNLYWFTFNQELHLVPRKPEISTMQSKHLDCNTHTKVVILNPSRTHTTFGKHDTEFRTPSEYAHQQLLQNYNCKEKVNYHT